MADVAPEQELEHLKARVVELEARLDRIGCQAQAPGAPKGVTCTLPFGHDGMHQQCKTPIFGGDPEHIAW